MTDELDRDDVKWFIRSLHNEYEKNTFIRDWCNVEVYFEHDPTQQQNLEEWGLNNEPEEEAEFIQVGQWTKLPVDIIRRPQLSGHNVNSLVRGITLGERNFLISRLDKATAEGDIGFVQTDELDIEDFVKMSGQVKNPKHLIMPLRDDLRDMRRNWRESEYFHFMSRELIVTDYSAINVHWYPPDKGEDVEGHGYLIGSDAIDITQKWHGDSEDPEGFQHEKQYDQFSLNRPFMVYLGTEIEIDEEAEADSLRERIDLLYRTVLSEPDIDPDGVLQFRV